MVGKEAEVKTKKEKSAVKKRDCDVARQSDSLLTHQRNPSKNSEAELAVVIQSPTLNEIEVSSIREAEEVIEFQCSENEEDSNVDYQLEIDHNYDAIMERANEVHIKSEESIEEDSEDSFYYQDENTVDCEDVASSDSSQYVVKYGTNKPPNASVDHSYEIQPRAKDNVQCHICDKTFSNNGNWWKHYHTVHGSKSFVCSLCGKSFSQKANLKRHYNAHTGYKPFMCGLCGQEFSQKSNLKKHESLHSEEKNYVCKYCCKDFSSLYAKNHHEKHVHELKRGSSGKNLHSGTVFVCEECPATFRSQKRLEQHMVYHA